MRLGGPIFQPVNGPDEWVAAVQAAGYRAGYAPVHADAPEDVAADYAQAAQNADILIAEVGAWSNPLSPDETTRQNALQHCIRSLDHADRLGACCCVNIAGSCGDKWDGPDPRDLTDETFDRIVETVRAIIDAVKPIRTFYTIEMMPWMYPDSPDNYLRLLKAIDRERAAVHFDPVNIVSSPQRYFDTRALLRECFEKLGPRIKSCHAKDIVMSSKFMTHLDEARPGTGALDYGEFLRGMNRLHPDTPIMLEHLPNEEEYRLAAEHIRSVATREGIAL